MQLYVMILRRLDATRVPDFLAAHERRLAELHARGIVLSSGPFVGGGGLTIFQAESADAAERLAAEDPFVINGTHQAEVLAWNPWLQPG